MKVMAAVFFAIAFSAPMAHADLDSGWRYRQLRAVNFMVGNWQGRAGELQVISSFKPDSSATVLVGASKMIDSAGKVVFFEKSIIAAVRGGLMLKPYPMGNKGVPFIGTRGARNRIVFENPDNQYPARITYWLDENHSLCTKVEGTENGAPKELDYCQASSN
jgi:hypothetical protein